MRSMRNKLDSDAHLNISRRKQVQASMLRPHTCSPSVVCWYKVSPGFSLLKIRPPLFAKDRQCQMSAKARGEDIVLVASPAPPINYDKHKWDISQQRAQRNWYGGTHYYGRSFLCITGLDERKHRQKEMGNKGVSTRQTLIGHILLRNCA